MALKRYGMLLKKYLKELNPIKYSRLTIDGSLMDFLYDDIYQEGLVDRVKESDEEAKAYYARLDEFKDSIETED